MDRFLRDEALSSLWFFTVLYHQNYTTLSKSLDIPHWKEIQSHTHLICEMITSQYQQPTSYAREKWYEFILLSLSSTRCIYTLCCEFRQVLLPDLLSIYQASRYSNTVAFSTMAGAAASRRLRKESLNFHTYVQSPIGQRGTGGAHLIRERPAQRRRGVSMCHFW